MATEGQTESNDTVAAKHPVISSSDKKKTLMMMKQKKKNFFSLSGLGSDHHHNMLDQLDQVDTLCQRFPPLLLSLMWEQEDNP